MPGNNKENNNNSGNFKSLPMPANKNNNTAPPFNALPLSATRKAARLHAPRRTNRTNRRRAPAVHAPRQFLSLCKAALTDRIYKDGAKLISITPLPKKHASGTFGYVKTVELTIEHDRNNSRYNRCLGVMKVSKKVGGTENGLPGDVLIELATASKIHAIDGVSKILYFNVSQEEIVTIMEHYLIDSFGFFIEPIYKNNLYNPLYAPTNVNPQMISYLLILSKSQLAEHKKLFMNIIKALLFQVCHALAEIHKLGFIHKDLKGENIFISEDGSIKIGDFGLSRYNPLQSAKHGSKLYNSTSTLSIKALEGLYTFEDSPGISGVFDSWSVGVLVNLLVFHTFLINFEPYGNKSPPQPALLAGRDHFLARLLHTFQDTKLHAMLKKLLKSNDKDRATVEDILKDPYFEGMTLQSSKEELKSLLTNCIDIRNGRTVDLLNPLLAPLLEQSRKKTNETAKSKVYNTKALVPLHPTKDESFEPVHADFTAAYDFGAKLIFHPDVRLPLYIWLHAIELLHRVSVTDVKVWNPLELMAGALIIADKLYPFKRIKRKQLVIDDIKPMVSRSAIEKAEIAIVNSLGGDLYPRKEGLVRVFPAVHALKLESAEIIPFLSLFILLFPTWRAEKGDRRSLSEFIDSLHGITKGGEADIPIEISDRLARNPELSDLLFHGGHSLDILQHYLAAFGLASPPERVGQANASEKVAKRLRAEYDAMKPVAEAE